MKNRHLINEVNYKIENLKEIKQIICQKCGAEFLIAHDRDNEKKITHCIFCGAEEIVVK